MRISGTLRVPWMKRATSSKALAVVLAAYCGYSGSTRIRSQPAPLKQGTPRERRAFAGPDARVFLRRLPGPRVQDDAVQDRQPNGARDLHHARIAEELLQVAAPRRGGRGFGGPPVPQQDGGPGGRAP